jgi:DNA-binding NarL/FixJ family response regulator
LDQRNHIVAALLPYGVEDVAIRVLVADDSEIVRRAICGMLQDDRDIQVVGETADFASTISRANELEPEIIVLDLHMPDDEKLFSIRSEVKKPCRIIAISFADDEETRTLARNIEASVLLEKMSLVSKLIPAIKTNQTRSYRGWLSRDGSAGV